MPTQELKVTKPIPQEGVEMNSHGACQVLSPEPGVCDLLPAGVCFLSIPSQLGHTPPLQPVPDPALSFLMTSERHRQFGLPRAVMFPKVSVDTTQFPRVMQGEGPTLPSST